MLAVSNFSSGRINNELGLQEILEKAGPLKESSLKGVHCKNIKHSSCSVTASVSNYSCSFYNEATNFFDYFN